MKRQYVAVIAVVGILLTAGCVDMTMTTTIAADGSIESMEFDVTLDSILAQSMEEDARAEGYDSLEAYLEAEMTAGMNADEEGIGNVTTSGEWLDDGDYRIVLTATDVDPEGMDAIDITIDGDTIRYEDVDFGGQDLDGLAVDDQMGGDLDDGFDDGFDDDFDDYENWEDDEWNDTDDFGEFEDDFGDLEAALMGSMSIEYVVVMPGEIEDTNADEVSEDGRTATWDLVNGDQPETAYVESSIDDSSFSIPGFGVAVGVVAVLSTLLGLRVTTRRP